MKQRIVIVSVCLIIGLLCITPFQSRQASTLSIETNGSIGFTGVYEPIGTPEEPSPPAGVARPPGQSLPQTNTGQNQILLLIGLAVLLFTAVLWRQKTNTKKVGIEP